jgi:hypothetical protein
MTTTELLRAAKRELEKGWCKHRLISHDGGVCMNGALCVAAAGGDRTLEAVYTLEFNRRELNAAFALMNRTALGGDTVAYNNAPDTTFADVLTWIDAAIAIAQAQEQASAVPETVPC